MFLQKTTIFLLCFLTTVLYGTAQANKSTIKGTVKDSSNKALSYATVGLYKLNQDKAVKNVFTSSKGEFVFENVDTGAYTIIISNTGFADKTSSLITIKEKETIDAGTLVLIPAAKDLQGVVVTTARRPLIERTEDKIVFNSESDPTLDGQQATDVLRKTPFLSVDNDGNVSLNGQKNFKILLNGKESSMFAKDPKEVLKSFPASLIKKIEVSTQPSAKYDAEGIGGIINIITKRKILGYNGSAGVYHSTAGYRNMNGNINAKYGNIGISSFLGMGGPKGLEGNNESVINNLNPTGSYKQRTLTGNTINGWAWKSANLEVSYDIDSLNTVSGYANVNAERGTNNLYQQSYLLMPNNELIQGTLNTLGTNSYPSMDFGVDYIKKFRKVADKEFTFRFNMEHEKTSEYTVSEQLQNSFARYSITDNQYDNYVYTFQSDLVLPLKNKQKIELGAKAVLRRSNADFTAQLAYTPGKYTTDTTNTNVFDYDQNIIGTYVSYGFNYKGSFFKLGTRAEWSELGGQFQSGKSTVQQRYFNVVPTVYISRNLKNNHSLNLSYNIRLQRPYIGDLNPFVNNSDSLNLRSGNTDLKPQIIHNVEFGYNFIKGDNNVSLKLTGFYSNNKITRYAFFDETKGITLWTVDNIGRNYGFSTSGFVSMKPVKWLSLNSNLGLKLDYIINKLNTANKVNGVSGWANMNGTADISKIFSATANAGMYKPEVSLQQRPGINYWYGVGFAAKLFNNKIRAVLRVDNFLEAQRLNHTITEGEGFSGYNKVYSPGRALAVALRWNFGKLTDNVSKKRGVSNDDLKK